jgi:hypothetical protein
VNHATVVMARHVVVVVYVCHGRGETGSHERRTRDEGHEWVFHWAHCPPPRTERQDSPRATRQGAHELSDAASGGCNSR